MSCMPLLVMFNILPIFPFFSQSYTKAKLIWRFKNKKRSRSSSSGSSRVGQTPNKQARKMAFEGYSGKYETMVCNIVLFSGSVK